MPPAVEPAQPPANAANNRIMGATEGHAAKLSVVKPVVVVMDTAWNKPSRNGWLVLLGFNQRIAETTMAT